VAFSAGSKFCGFFKFWHVFISADFISASHSLDKTWFKFCDSSYQSLSHITLPIIVACTRSHLFIVVTAKLYSNYKQLYCLLANKYNAQQKIGIHLWSAWSDVWKIYPGSIFNLTKLIEVYRKSVYRKSDDNKQIRWIYIPRRVLVIINTTTEDIRLYLYINHGINCNILWTW
jgi:hypothetical protein